MSQSSFFYEVVADSTETANKCTITPLSYREDFKIFRPKGAERVGPLRSQILLHPSGEPLTQIVESKAIIEGIASIDCIWKKVDKYLSYIDGPLPKLASIPEGFKTAYPRKNKHDKDPSQGLATIEAIFIAAAILGVWDESLLAEYYFGRDFIELNRSRFYELGIRDIPVFASKANRPRNSLLRKINRGKLHPLKVD